MAESIPRLLIADDHRLLREGLRRSLTSNGFSVIAEASDGQQAMDLTRQYRPDLVLMDVTMPILDGISATQRLVRSDPDVRVVMLTMHDDVDVRQRAAAAGARGFLIKDCSTTDIVRTLQRVLETREGFVEASAVKDSTSDAPTTTPVITKRETEVLQLIADGRSTADVASELYVSQKTVKNHLASIYAKLGAHDRTQAVLRGARLGLIQIQD